VLRQPKQQGQGRNVEPLNAETRPLRSQAEDAYYFVEEVRRQLYAKYGQQALYDGGLQVRSSRSTQICKLCCERLAHGSGAVRPSSRMARRR